MANQFSSGKEAFGFCDRCGFRFHLNSLKFQVVKQEVTALKVCDECMDEDNPQLMLGMYPVSDPQAVRDARPDPSMTESRELTGQVSLSTIFIPPVY